jgi:hypothetical protein
LLYQGVFLKLNNKKYFVQARIISHVFDTKGAEKALNMTSTGNSLYGSPLVKDGIKGINFKEVMKKTSTCNDYRIYADLNHKTRIVGQSGKCCPFKDVLTPDDLYIPVEEDVKEKTNYKSNIMNPGTSLDSLCITNDYKKGILTNELNVIYENFITKLDQTKRHNSTSKEAIIFNWHHFCHDPEDKIFDYLFFPHCCYKYRKYERIKNEDFKEYVRNGTNGFKGESFFSKLPYSNIETDFSWDIMHVVKNVASHLIEILSGDRCESKPNIKILCEKLGCHKMYYKDHEEPWKISDANKKKIDTFISCIRIPVGYDFQVKWVFYPSGILDCDDYQRIVTCLLDLIGFIGQLPYQYREYLSMLQFDFNEILRSWFPKDYDYELLFKLVNETGICRQGLFPYSELYFDGLQLLDLPYSIRDIGPVRSYSSYTGERFNKDVKEKTRKGGNNSELTTFKRVAEGSDVKTMYVYIMKMNNLLMI